MQIAIPQTVGRAKAIKLHFHLLVSFLTVRRVVAQGKCKTVKIIMLMAVIIVQPLALRILLISKVSDNG